MNQSLQLRHAGSQAAGWRNYIPPTIPCNSGAYDGPLYTSKRLFVLTEESTYLWIYLLNEDKIDILQNHKWIALEVWYLRWVAPNLSYPSLPLFLLRMSRWVPVTSGAILVKIST